MKKLLSKAENLLDFSGGILRNLPNITLCGTEAVDIDNFKALLDFSSDCVRVNTAQGIVRIDGNNLKISVMTDENLSVNGQIRNLSFE